MGIKGDMIFKDDRWIYYTNLECSPIMDIHYTVELSMVKHLDDANIICHYTHHTGNMIPIYYEYVENGTTYAITKHDISYVIVSLTSSFTKDYTMINMKLL